MFRYILLLIFISTTINAQVELNFNTNWNLINKLKNINIKNLTIPQSVTTALRNAKLINDPLFRYNDVKYRWITTDNNWIFENKFQLDSKQLKANLINLIFESIDTFASVYLNDKFILYASNQFLKYEIFNVSSYFKSGLNMLQLRFASPVRQANYLSKIYPYYLPVECPPDVQSGECHVNMIRKEQCSFSWDWGPALAPIGINGLVKLQLIEKHDFNFSLSVFKQKDLKNWIIDIDLTVINLLNTNQAVLKVKIEELNFLNEIKLNLTSAKFDTKVKVSLSSEDIKLWWPNGYGAQKMYNLTLELSVLNTSVIKSKQIGFRSVELVQEPIRNSLGLTFYFKINELPIFLKGSNWIPADSFKESITESYLEWLMHSARQANMNVLRVWGGGVYESEKFYDLANTYGILIWQDFMFACSLYPTNRDFLANVQSEIVYQVNRLKHHPAIVVWAGNNENEAAISTNWYNTSSNLELYQSDYRALYVDTIMNVVNDLDKSRPFLSSSPTNGLETIKENWLAKNPYDLLYGDLHFYDYTINGWDETKFPIPRFMSEFGVQSLPSYATLSEVYSFPDDAGLFSDLNQHRQHHSNGNHEIFNQIQFNLKPVDDFEAIIYMSQIYQAMTLKTGTELYRRSKNVIDPQTSQGYCMGTMYWQLNDVWQAPTWSSIEYKGKWKLAHYFIRNSYSSVIITPHKNQTHLIIHAVSDTNEIVEYNFTLRIYSFKRFKEFFKQDYSFKIKELDSFEVASLDLKTLKCDSDKCLVEITGLDGYLNFMFLNLTQIVPKDLLKANIRVKLIEQVESDLFEITLEVDSVALFVHLDLNTTLVNGYFSDNGFHMTTPNKVITFKVYNKQIDVSYIKSYLKVICLNDIYGNY